MHWLHLLQNWLAVHTGTVNEPGVYYGFFSGFGSDLGEVTLIGVIVGAFASWYHRNNCHVDGCRRIAHRLVTGLDEHGQPVTYHVCRRHHPVPAPTADDVHRAHHALRRKEPECSPASTPARGKGSRASG